MQDQVQALSERERQTLRLLLAGHDAKSIAQTLGLSVHTINERLREARRKLGVGSSREAARRLAQAEGGDPHFLGDKPFGVAPPAGRGKEQDASAKSRRVGPRLALIAGGLTIMFAIAAAAILAASFQPAAAPTQAPTAASVPVADKASTAAAEAWARVLDDGRWGESWRTAGTLFKSQLTEADWTAKVQPLRQQLGAVSSRKFKSVSNAATLPGAPNGEYAIVQFDAAFAMRPDAVETVVLAREGAAWKVIGYFIR